MEPVAESTDPVRETFVQPPETRAPVASGPWRCAADPSVETYLRCGRCYTPICPRCLIQTPVGSRCRACARIRKLPMFELHPLDYLRAIGAALGASVVCGVALALVLHLAPFLGILRFFLMIGVGYAVGEAVSKLTGRKRGTALGVIAGLAVVVGVVAGQAAFFIVGGANPLLAFAVSAATSLLQIWSLLGLAVAAFVAFTRAR